MYLSKYALVRVPSHSVIRGLRLKHRGAVNFAKAESQHGSYRNALLELGYTLIVMPPDERYPDGVFVEDPAIILQQSLIKGKMCKPERQGEEEAIFDILAPYFRHHLAIPAGVFLEGGDVLITPKRLYIGISSRTNYEGAEQLAKIAKLYYQLEIKFIELHQEFLHLKGQASFHRGEGTRCNNGLLLVHEALASAFSNSGYNMIFTPHNERFGANAISEKNAIIIHANRPRTKKLLTEAGFHPMPVQMSEFEKIDGALSCLSKIF